MTYLILPGIILSILAGIFCGHLPDHSRRQILCILAIFFTGSEMIKQVILTITTGHYVWWNFPFQLCSMPVYLLPIALITKNQKLRTAIYTFLADFATLAGLCTFLDTSGLYYRLPVLTVHSFLWHFLMILTGVMIGMSAKVKVRRQSHPDSQCTYHSLADCTLSGYLNACKIFLLCSAIAELINYLFHAKGSINMFYISLWEPMTQIVFTDIEKSAGRPAAVLLYITAILIGAGIVHFIRHIFTTILIPTGK